MDKTAAERMRRYRNKGRNDTVTESQGSVTVGVTAQAQRNENTVTEGTVTVSKGKENTGKTEFYKRKYPALVYAVSDPDKRKRLTRVCQELKARNLLGEVMYGVGGPKFSQVNEVLECLS